MQVDISTTGCKGSKTILEQNMGMKKHNKKAELINKMEKELQELKEGSKATEYIDSLRAKLKKVPNWKHQAMMA